MKTTISRALSLSLVTASLLVSACATDGKKLEVGPAQRQNPLAGMRFYRAENPEIRTAAVSSDQTKAQAFQIIADQPAAVWLGAWSGPIKAAIEKLVVAAEAQGAQLVAVPYNIPYRDCGQHSAGGLEASAYETWIAELAAGLGQHRAILILEPDAIPLIDCLTPELRAERWRLLHQAIATLKTQSRALVYVDVGHGNWIPAADMLQRLDAIGIDRADGFAINTSNYQLNDNNLAFARSLQQHFPDKGYVFDTSRNGRGPSPDLAWCNPPGRAIGSLPQVLDGKDGPDAYLWVKRPGESDGTCNGGPKAGVFWSEMALELVRNVDASLLPSAANSVQEKRR